MKEIKFRGKRIDNGEWVYGYYACIDAEHFIFTGDDLWGDDANAYLPERFKVNPKTVGQYSGLKDKNGVEIYEGGIVKWEYSSSERFATGTGEVKYEPTSYLVKGLSSSFELDCLQTIEVIGNVFDNKESEQCQE